MKYEFSLDENDFLNDQLYFASKSKNIQEQRVKSFLIIAITFIGCTIFSYIKNSPLSHYFLGVTIILILFYPIWDKRRHKKHYEKHVNEVFNKRFNKKIELIIANQHIEEIESNGNSSISIKSLEEIIETRDYIFLKLDNETAIVIPKLKIQNIEELYSDIKHIIESNNIKFKRELSWKW